MIFIYRAIDAGMVTMRDVVDGAVTLADIVAVNHYLDMKQDIEYAVSKENEGKAHAYR